MQMILWVILVLTNIITSPKQHSTTNETWVVSSASTLKVDGKTNINNFSCMVASYGKSTDQLICEKSIDGCKVTSHLTIAIALFDCHNRMMTKDLQKTLKSQQFPEMVIGFKKFSALPSTLNKGMIFSGKADIVLAGVTRSYDIKFTTLANTSTEVELLGKKTLLFTDFGLTPPSKLGGTIKVKNELDVEFKLLLKKALT